MNTPMQSKGWWDAVVDPAVGQPQGYFWGGLVSGLGDAWNATKNFVSNNPLTSAGVGLGAITGGAKGALKGLALGGAGDALFNPTSYASQWLGTNGNTSGLMGGSFGFGTPAAPAGGYLSPGGAATNATTGTNFSAPALPAPTSFTAPAGGAAPSAGITGAFGGVGGYAADGMGPPLSAMGGGTGGFEALVERGKSWGQSNPNTAALGIQLAGSLAGRGAQKRQEQMMRDAMERTGEAYQFNRGVAESSNADAQQAINDARSTNNPYATATRSYAQAQMTGNRAADRIEDEGMSRGLSAGTVAAEKRRAKLQTSLGATTAYNQGFATGSQAQQQGVAAGNNMRRTISAPGYDANLGKAVADRGADETGQITALLENYLGNPTRKLQDERVSAGGVRQ